ncbi:MAG: Ig-like domain-containing protein [Actinomycetota bacterium]
MRKRFLSVLAACAVIGLVLAQPAYATIISASGAAVKIAPPATLVNPKLESDTQMFVWDEQQNVTLPNSLNVDISTPGLYDDNDDLTPAAIPAGTVVSSHFVHGDNVGSGGGGHNLDGTVVVDAEILGIIIMNPNLDDSDFLGAPGTEYPTGLDQRRFTIEAQDFLIEQVDRRTVFIHMNVRAHADEIRIITEAAPTPVTPTVATEVHNAAHQDITGQTVAAGTVVHDKAIVTGSGPTPTGTVDFARFTNGTCSGTPAAVESDVALDGGGTAESSTFTTVQGDMAYLVHYDGDANYNPGDGPCEPLKVEKKGGEGCTPGYWKQPHHFDSWVGFAPGDSFEAVFGRDAFAGSPTLLTALSTGGGGMNALGRHSTAALLNASHPGVDFAFTSAEVISMFQGAFDAGGAAIENTKDIFDAANNGGCGLN